MEKERFMQMAQDKQFLWNFTREELKSISKSVSAIKETKYRRNRVPKYRFPGYKGMPIETIDRFFSAFLPEEYRMKTLFLVQAFLGLRIGEVVKIQVEDLDFQNKQIRIKTEKEDPFEVIDSMYMHEKLEFLLLDYVSLYERQIQQHNNHLFWATNAKSKTPWLSPDRARNMFREICKRANIDEIYGKRQPLSDLENWKEGQLHRWTTHSLRYSFARYLAENEVPIEIAKHLMRHSSIKSTEIYYQRPKEQVDATLAKLFAR